MNKIFSARLVHRFIIWMVWK